MKHTDTIDDYEDQLSEPFDKQLESLINRESMETGSNTPDFILAEYLFDCLRAFDNATRKRTIWYGSGYQCRYIRQLKASLRDFIGYLDPCGGVSQVPLGPFERAKELLATIYPDREDDCETPNS